MYLEYSPTASLKKYIQFHWFYRCESKQGNQHVRIFPDGCTDYIFRLTPLKTDSYICGPSTRFFDILISQQDFYYGIRFQPGLAKYLFDIPANEISDQVLDSNWLSNDVLLSSKIIESHSSEEDFKKIINLIEVELKKKFYTIESRVDFNMIQFFKTYVLDHSVQSLANQTQMSRRHLTRLFMSHFGLNPSLLRNILKLELFRRQLPRETPSLSDFSYQLGFNDQAHMNKTFKKISGYTPHVLMSHFYNTDSPVS